MPARSAARFQFLAACSGAVAVAAGAFGAHALRARLEPRWLEVFETAARYQMYHALALLAVAIFLAAAQARSTSEAASTTRATPTGDTPTRDTPTRDTPDPRERLLVASGWAFVLGTVLFSGSLYAMALSGVRALGAITPIGGAAFLVGWTCLALAARPPRGR